MTIIKNNVIYDQEKALATDIYYPSDTTSATKILIFWHGGGWFQGDKADVKPLGVKLANAGFMTFVPNYRLAPRDIFPAAHDDALNFIQWLLSSKYTDHGDEKNIMQIGASVGGTLALYIAGRYGFPTVTWSAPVLYTDWIEQHANTIASSDPQTELGLTKIHDIYDSFYKYFTLTYTASADPSILTKLDATKYQLNKLNNLLMINSADELTPITSVLKFADFLAKQNHEVELLIIKGHRHAMSYSKDYLDETLDFLFQTIKRQ